jgi:hypothetical protein
MSSYAVMPNRWKFVFQTKTLCNIMQYATTTCPTMLLCKLANICGLNHNKYISYECWNLQIYEIEIIRNTKFWVTPRCPSHRSQMRRGTPLTRSWFMPALNTRRFATVLTHQLTCSSHAEYHFCVTVYQSDVQSELQSVCKQNLKFKWVYSFLPNSHIHRHA